MTGEPIAVVDIGSNSSRLLVAQIGTSGQLVVLEEVGASLRLVRDLENAKRLQTETIRRTVEVLRQFKAVAEGTGARSIRVVATAAVREAVNGQELLDEVWRATGLRVEVIDGRQEATYALHGTLYALDAESGIMLDVGGGSLQLARFRAREMVETWSLPLGALRLSDRFLRSDPPTAAEVKALEKHVRQALKETGLEPLPTGERLIGTGGTIRNLGKLDRRSRAYPITRLHSYVVGEKSITEIAATLVGKTLAARAAMSGVSRDRADSLGGGALVVRAVMERLGAEDMTVSGHGLREGVALDKTNDGVPSVSDVRRAAVAALVARSELAKPGASERRATLARRVRQAVLPDLSDAWSQVLEYAALLLDVGRSVDYYRRHEHTEMILTATDMPGFSHREVVLIAAVVRLAEDQAKGLKRYGPLIESKDLEPLRQLAAILALADEVERRIPAEAPTCLDAVRRGNRVGISAGVDLARTEPLLARIEETCRTTLELEERNAAA